MNFFRLGSNSSDKGFTMNVSYTMVAGVLNQLRWILLVWIATQTLSVSDYGIFALITSLILMAVDLSDLGINASVTRFSAQFFQKKQFNLFSFIIAYAFRRKCINACLAVGIMVLFSKQISQLLFHSNDLYGFIIIGAGGVGLGLFNGLNMAIFQGKQAFAEILKVSIGSFILSIIITGILYLMGKLNLSGFIGIYIFILASSLMLSGWKLKEDYWKGWNWKYESAEIKDEFKKFGNWMFIWAIICALQSRIDVVMLAQMTNTNQVAYYDIAMKYTRPLMMLFSAYGQVLQPLMAGYQNKKEIVFCVKSTYSFLWKMSILLIMGILLANLGVKYIIGIQYLESVIPLRVILVGLIFFIWTMPYNTALYSMKKPYVFTIQSIIGLFVTIGGNYFILTEWGAIGASCVFLFVQFTCLICSIIFYKWYMRKGNL